MTSRPGNTRTSSASRLTGSARSTSAPRRCATSRSWECRCISDPRSPRWGPLRTRWQKPSRSFRRRIAHLEDNVAATELLLTEQTAHGSTSSRARGWRPNRTVRRRVPGDDIPMTSQRAETMTDVQQFINGADTYESEIGPTATPGRMPTWSDGTKNLPTSLADEPRPTRSPLSREAGRGTAPCTAGSSAKGCSMPLCPAMSSRARPRADSLGRNGGHRCRGRAPPGEELHR